jgi:glucan 1,3-beta-glucosidase
VTSLQNWFFWTWKIGVAQSGNIESPSWSYQLGLQNGWIPLDPRQSAGVCGNANPWQGPLTAPQVGGNGAGQITANVAALYPWPPNNIANGGPVGQLPQYTPSAPIVVLPVPAFTAPNGTKINAGTGWNNAQDTTQMSVQNPNCPYLTPWQEGNFAVPPQCPAA